MRNFIKKWIYPSYSVLSNMSRFKPVEAGEHFQVSEYKQYRALIGSHNALHSLINMNKPHILELPYLTPLLGSLRLVRQPEKVLIFGLGGGAMLHHLWHHYPTLAIAVVERSKEVIRHANKHFGIPLDDPRLQLHHGAVEDFLAERCDAGMEQTGALAGQTLRHQVSSPTQQQKPMRSLNAHSAEYDVLIIDIASSAGIPAVCEEERFFERCAALLDDNGLLLINLCTGSTAELQSYLNRIRCTFNQICITYPIRGYANMVCCVMKNDRLSQVMRGDVKGLDFEGLRFDSQLGWLADGVVPRR